MFDGEAFGREIVAAVKEHVGSAMAPMMVRLEAIERRLDALPIPRDGRDADAAAVAGMVRTSMADDVREIRAMAKEAADTAAKAAELAETMGDAVTREVARAVAELPPAPAGPAGRDGDSVTPDDVAPLIEASVARAVAALPVARDGRDGVGVAGGMIDKHGHLVLTLSSGEVRDLGAVVGRDGRDGVDGKDGAPGEKGAPGRDGVNGRDGAQGLNGADGRGISVAEIVDGTLRLMMTDGDIIEAGPVVGPRGADGVAGEKGADGRDGVDGADGKDGAPGIDGKDGRGISGAEVVKGVLRLFMTDGQVIQAGSVVGPSGADGTHGKDGAAGRDGVDGKDGAPGLDGRGIAGAEIREGVLRLKMTDGEQLDAGLVVGPRGADGAPGEKGAPGRDGVDGADGKDGAPGRDGLDVRDLFVEEGGNLLATLSDGSTRNLGPFRGKDGSPGQDGAPGRDGRDGVGFDDLDMVVDDEGVHLRFVRGEEVRDYRLPVVIDRGTWRDGQSYAKGAGVTYAGSFWISQEDGNSEKPETGKAWRLAVKRGRDRSDPVKTGGGRE